MANYRLAARSVSAIPATVLLLLAPGAGFAQTPADAPAAPAPAPALTPAPAAEPAAPPAALAPEESKATKHKAEETITVTGTRLRRKDLSTPAPVTLIGKEQMQQSGRVSLGDFLQTLPEQGNATNTSVNNAGTGATKIDLRGLGANRTLVLVNGRRWVPGGLGADDSVDLNSIPASAIDHIEILKDGASAVYGSDAISGVVNIITKKKFDGSDVSAFGGTTTHADGTQYSIDGSTGINGDKGSALFSAGWYQNYPIFAGNRGFASPQVFFDGSTGGTASGTGIGGYFPSGSSTIPSGRILGFHRGVTIPTASALYNNLMTQFPRTASFIWDPSSPLGWRPYKGNGLPPNGDQYNYQDVNYLTTPQSRFSLFSTGEARIGANARAYYEASFVQRNSKQQLAPEPLVLDPGGSGILTSAQNIYNPFGTDVYVRRRLIEFGDRVFTQDNNTYRFVTGIDGTIPDGAGPLSGWFWDVSANYGRSQGTQDFKGALDTARIANAVGPSFIDANGPHCGTPGNIIAGCVPLDLFHGPGSITPDQVAGLGYDGVFRTLNALTAVQANLSGELFKLFSPRPVGLAAGYEYRFQAGEQIPDPIAAFSQSSDNNQLPTSGHFYSNEGYAELSVPLVGDLPGINNLELTAAIRFYDYNTFGSGATYKLGGLYRPVQGFSIRGTYSTAFRAPSIADLFTGQVDSFENVSDPCSGVHGAPPANCGAAANNGDVSTQLKAKTGGNPNLKPETATTVTGGLVLEPGVLLGVQSLKRLSFTVDYYSINITNAINPLGANTILTGCYPQSGTPNQAYCALITRDPTTQIITRINDFQQNSGAQSTDGVDFAVNYSVPTGAGNFGVLADVTWLDQNNLTLGNGQVIRGAGNWDLNTSGLQGTYPHWKALGGLNWNLAGFGAGLVGHYVGGFKECGDPGGGGFYSGLGLCYQDNTYQRAISPYAAMDMFISYRFLTGMGKTTAMVGMNNVFDSSPPFIANAFEANTDPTGGYDIVGRFVYARLAHNF